MTKNSHRKLKAKLKIRKLSPEQVRIAHSDLVGIGPAIVKIAQITTSEMISLVKQ